MGEVANGGNEQSERARRGEEFEIYSQPMTGHGEDRRTGSRPLLSLESEARQACPLRRSRVKNTRRSEENTDSKDMRNKLL